MLGDLILSLIRLGEEADNPTKESFEGLQLGIRVFFFFFFFKLEKLYK